ncbi:FHA domain-containing protein [Demequina sp. NBRC 110056]|uniref:FHA domain-containing protein n=1 Tax=Demequina sp. NBRC 110056 TaxID=1570345 RepID=UPI000A0227F0|nr:FHA domain-containing protein [Demequina sp. NBRC 110056]
MFGAAPLLIAASAVAVVALAVWIWMALALGALLRRLGGRPGLAWVPVARWVEAARGARMPVAPVAIARTIGLLGLIALVAGIALAVGSTVDAAVDPTTRALLVGGGIAFGLGSLVGWALWIYGAGTIEMRLKAPAALTWLAAISPVIWASVMGWGRYGRPVDAGRFAASSAGAPAAEVPASPSPEVASAPGPADGDGAPSGGWEALAAGAAAAPTWDGVAARERGAQASAPGAPATESPAAPAATSVSEPDPVTAPMRGLWQQVSWPDEPVTLDESSAPGAASADEGPAAAATSSGADDAHSGESVAWREAQAALDAERHAEPEPYTGPVSPYLGSSQEPQTAELAPDLGGAPDPFDNPIPATAELQEIPWMAPAPTPPTPSAPTPSAPTPAEVEQSSPVAEPHVAPEAQPVAQAEPAPRPASPPNPWDFIHEAPAARPEAQAPPAATVPEPPPAPEHEPAAESAPTAEAEGLAAPVFEAETQAAPETAVPLDAQAAAPSDDDLDLPADFAAPAVPLSPWAPRPAASHSSPAPYAQTAPMTPPTPPASRGGDDEDDHTVMVQRHRDAWVLETSDGVRYVLPEERITVGRAAARITPGVMGVQDETRTMSKVHAELTLVSGQWHARDLGSTNGTFVRVDGSERQVPQDVPSPVDGDLLLGDLVARIVEAEDGARR